MYSCALAKVLTNKDFGSLIQLFKRSVYNKFFWSILALKHTFFMKDLI